jgi:hypothetical protein
MVAVLSIIIVINVMTLKNSLLSFPAVISGYVLYGLPVRVVYYV